MSEPIFSNHLLVESALRNAFYPTLSADDEWAEIIPVNGVSVVLKERAVLFRRESEHARMPEMQHDGDAGFDLFCAQDVKIAPHSFADIDTHIQVQMPPGIYCRIVGRSSTLRKRGLLVNEGIIDNGYRGSIFVGVFNMTGDEKEVKIGDRFAQLLLLPRVVFPWFEAHQLSETSRGGNGFGSTGMR